MAAEEWLKVMGATVVLVVLWIILSPMISSFVAGVNSTLPLPDWARPTYERLMAAWEYFPVLLLAALILWAFLRTMRREQYPYA